MNRYSIVYVCTELQNIYLYIDSIKPKTTLTRAIVEWVEICLKFKSVDKQISQNNIFTETFNEKIQDGV